MTKIWCWYKIDNFILNSKVRNSLFLHTSWYSNFETNTKLKIKEKRAIKCSSYWVTAFPYAFCLNKLFLDLNEMKHASDFLLDGKHLSLHIYIFMCLFVYWDICFLHPLTEIELTVLCALRRSHARDIGFWCIYF